MLRAFVTLLLLIGAHTMLETARDALLLARFPTHALGLVYVVAAGCVFPFALVVSRLAARWGPRRLLAGALGAAALLVVALFALHTSPVTLVALYVLSALVGGTLVPLFWSAVGSAFTVTQGRRLLGVIGAAGVLGGAIGSTSAVALLGVVRVKALLPISALVFLAAAAVVAFGNGDDGRRIEDGGSQPAEPVDQALRPLYGEPFVRWIALFVAVSTGALVLVDFTFKWTVAQSVPRAEIAPLVARTYAIVNLTSLVAQLFVSGALVRRIGITATAIVTPLALLAGAVWSVLLGAALAATLVLKGIDGTLRNSLHRAASELVYLPLPSGIRTRAKPVIDGALAKVTQAVGGAVLLILGETMHLSPVRLTAAAAAALCFWVAATSLMRAPYLDLLRRVIASGDAGHDRSTDPLDMESAESLVAYLAHDDPHIVVGAMNALARRGRARLVPALVLRHEDEAVLLHALRLFAASDRQEWVPRARHLLADEREAVRMAAARALASHGALEAHDLVTSATPRMRGYAAVQLALSTSGGDPLEHPTVAEMLASADASMGEARLGMLSAVADAPPSPSLHPLLGALSARAGGSRSWTEELARAIAAHKATWLIPRLVERLATRDGRDTLRQCLVSLGEPAFEALRAALHDRATPRGVRVHLPNSIARFGSLQAANLLLEVIESDPDGLVRYKAIRALGRLVSEARVRVDGARVERLALASLLEHHRLLGLRAPIDARPWYRPSGMERRAPTEMLLVGLLDDKLRQSLERTFRLLKIAHPGEDIHRVHDAYLSDDPRARAAAMEFLDTLLRRSEEERLRELLLAGAESSDVAELAARGARVLGRAVPADRDAALRLLSEDADTTVAALAQLHVAALAGRAARVVVGPRGGPALELSLGESAWRQAAGDGHA